MQISLNSKVKSGNHALNDILDIHSSADSSCFYQETAVPFMLLLMSIHADNLAESSLSLFTPEDQFNGSISELIQGRNSAQMHQHNCFEFTYILKGSMYQIVEGKRYFYPTGSCCLINRNTLHTELTATDFVCIFFSVSSDFIKRLGNYGNNMLFPVENRVFSNMIFQFVNKNLDKNHVNSKDFLDFVPLISENEQKIIVHNIFENMINTLISPQIGSTFYLQNLFLQLIDVLCNPNYYNIVHVTAAGNNDSLLFARIDQLLDQYHGRITNKALSEYLNYDGSYIGRIVKKYTGLCLFDYSMQFTMKEAARLLTESEQSIHEISSSLQFNNRTHFYKIFKEHFNMTPKEYRLQYCKTNRGENNRAPN